MENSYPRFLYSYPRHAKVKGAFVVHTAEPEIICRVSEPQDLLRQYFSPVVTFEKLEIELLKPKLGNGDADKFTKEIQDTIDDMYQWILEEVGIGGLRF